jgi:HAD superfamily hydrolase (TIGR01509 family)
MNPHAVIFDMDGTMLDTERLYQSIHQLAAADCGIEWTDQHWHGLLGRNKQDGAELLARWFGPDFAVESFWDRCRAHYPGVFGEGIPLKPGVIETLDFFAARKMPMAVATSTSRERAQKHLRSAGLLDRFPIIAGGDEVSRGKPEPDIFVLAAKKLGVDPNRCLAFEDSDAGVLSAHRAGMPVIMVIDIKPLTDDVARVAQRVTHSLDEALAWLKPHFDFTTHTP